MAHFLHSWRQDLALRGILRSSSYLFSSNALTVGLSVIQGILVARLVGMEGLGLVTAVTVFASNINRLLSFRMSEVLVKHLGEAFERADTAGAAAAIRYAAAVETGTSLLAFLVLALLSPWAAAVLAKDPASSHLFVLYGLVLLGNVIYETSAGVLQALRRFDQLAKVQVAQSLLTALIILLAFWFQQGVVMVLVGYLAGKVFAGLAVAGLAYRAAEGALGAGWWSLPPPPSFERRRLFTFALNTNLQGTVNLLARDNIPLLLAALRSPVEVGYFKLALSLINLVMLPIEPFIAPTYAEISRTIASRQWDLTRRLLRRVSLISAAWTLLAGGVILLAGAWLIPFVYGAQAAPAYPAFQLLFIGYGFANILHWNRPLLLALGKPGFPLAVAALVGSLEIALTLWLVPAHGYLLQALILSGYFVVSITIILWRGLGELNQRAQAEARMPARGGGG